jgi:hypothetical protein
MNPIKRIAPALAALALFARPAAAQGIHTPIRYVEQAQAVGPWVGYVAASTKLTLNDSTEVPIGPKAAPAFGVQYELRASGPMSLQARVGYMPTTRQVFLAEAVNDSNAIRAIATGRTAKVGVLLAEVGFLFHLTGPRAYHGVAPYLGLTGGFARQVSGTDPQDSTVPAPERYRFGPAFAVGTNLGTDVFLTERLSLRLELDGRLWRENGPAGFRAKGQTSLGEWNSASGAQIGAMLHF